MSDWVRRCFAPDEVSGVGVANVTSVGVGVGVRVKAGTGGVDVGVEVTVMITDLVIEKASAALHLRV